MFWSIKISGEVLSKLKSRGFRAISLSTYGLFTLYTKLPHNLIKQKLVDLLVFVRRGFLFLWVLGMGCVILLWHSLSYPYNYFD